MTEDEIKLLWKNYLNWRLETGQISKGKFALHKISEDSFNQFQSQFTNDELFCEKVIKINTLIERDKKIDDIFDDFD
jgi:hypothetical protein